MKSLACCMIFILGGLSCTCALSYQKERSSKAVICINSYGNMCWREDRIIKFFARRVSDTALEGWVWGMKNIISADIQRTADLYRSLENDESTVKRRAKEHFLSLVDIHARSALKEFILELIVQYAGSSNSCFLPFGESKPYCAVHLPIEQPHGYEHTVEMSSSLVANRVADILIDRISGMLAEDFYEKYLRDK